MCLIGLLGPVTASVANLLAIGLVALVDALYLGRAIPGWTLAGAALVALGFGVLLWAGEGEPGDEGEEKGEGEDVDEADAGEVEDAADDQERFNARHRLSGDGLGDPPWERRSSSPRR